ncbi:uncharacterized protein C1orf131 homolog [Rousettus aegyptiacus]|uniref:Uncharacterized protein n=1 Tax=Rousettus aegyptiacus TaxID=9407 RepID=A0A7J8B969_ROUAE|nr:uncharacterized protein C1orf131 homolog [Rousettus aegyptiacus]KAF6395061.1 hypothetical protein HJG63_001765 [Rousettus aegyptiacus]
MARERDPARSCHTLLDAVLRDLYDLGDTDDAAGPKRTRKKDGKKGGAETAAAAAAGPAPPPGAPAGGQRRGARSFFAELRGELQGTPAVPPAGAAAAPRGSERVELVEFRSSRRKAQQPRPAQATKTKASVLKKDVDVQEFNLEKARLEVHRFGITGYGKGQERVLERERAVMLGAQPPKKSYVNYKVLQEQIREQKAAREAAKRTAQDTDIFKRKKRKGQEDRKSRKKEPTASTSSGGRLGQVGRFKNGTLVLSQVDIKKINSSRVAR